MKSIARAPWLLALAALFISAPAVAQQTYPNKPIRFIIPFAPGGSTSILGRLVGDRLTKSWGQPVIVDNRPGGGTVIGTQVVAKSPADGYTLLMATATHVVHPWLNTTPYDAVEDFAAVATLSRSEYLLTINPAVPAMNVKEFITYAKSKPGQLNFSSPGNGGLGHLSGELFNLVAGVKLQHIPYKGSAPAITDLLGGQVQASFVTPIGVLSHVQAGKLRALAITGKSRLESLPQVPTFTEAGLAGFDVTVWFGVLMLGGTPRDIIGKLNGEINAFLAVPEVKANLASQGMAPFVSTPEQFAALMKADSAMYGKVIKAANIKPE